MWVINNYPQCERLNNMGKKCGFSTHMAKIWIILTTANGVEKFSSSVLFIITSPIPPCSLKGETERYMFLLTARFVEQRGGVGAFMSNH